MSQHTAKGWRADIGDKTNLVRNSDGKPLAVLWRGDAEAAAEQDANAHMMAAAVDMYEAIAALTHEFEKLTKYGSEIALSANQSLELARRACLKAEGRT